MSDGGEGLLDVFGGATGRASSPARSARRSRRRGGSTAARRSIEMARASGLVLAGGAGGNDPLTATTRGTGELIARAIEQGARTVLVGLGGSATTDGGLGAVEALGSRARLTPIDLQVACDVRTRFVDAAAVFAPQKGATPAQVRLLDGPPRAARRALPRRVRRRRTRRRRHRRRRRTGRRAARRRRPARSPASTSSPSTSTSTNGSPRPTSSSPARATSTPRASTARSSAVSATSPPQHGVPVVVIVGDADPAPSRNDAVQTGFDRRVAGRAVRRAAGVQRAALVHRAGDAGEAFGDAAPIEPDQVVVVAPGGAGAWTLAPASRAESERLAGDVVAEHHQDGRRADAASFDRDRRSASAAPSARRGRGDRLSHGLDRSAEPST